MLKAQITLQRICYDGSKWLYTHICLTQALQHSTAAIAKLAVISLHSQPLQTIAKSAYKRVFHWKQGQ